MSPYLEKYLRPEGTRSVVAVPIYYRQEPRFVLVAVMNSGPRAWSQEEVEVLQAAADQLLIAIERAELFEQVSRGKHEWEATFDALTDGIFIFDRSGKLSRVNQVAAALEGQPVDKLIGRQCCSIMQGIKGEECRVIPVIQTGRPVTFELIPEHMQQALLITISPLTSDRPTEDGSAPGAVCVVRDLSELRAAEAAAREQRGFLVKLIEHANDAIFAVSPEGKFIWFNEQLSKLSGYTRDELFVSEFNRFIPEGERTVAVEWFTRALEGEPQTFEMRGVKRSGEIRLLQMTYTPIYDKGRVSSVLSIARDITEERVAAERAAQADKLRALGQLASGVAHNFNNILAAVLGHAQLARRDTADDRLLRRIDVIERAALDGAQTVKRIQGFAIQQNEDVFEPIDVNQLLQDSANLTRARWADDAQASGLPYEVELKLSPLPITRGSGSELREVFVNIILNALDAMPQGGCLLIASEVRNSQIHVRFSDSGVGMSRPVRQRIFEPFFTTKGTKGMGLGLAVSYSIVERHGGRIEVTSSPGHGSTFSIVLPVSEGRDESPAENLGRFSNPVKVLVIDDDQLVREAIVGMLLSSGHEAEQAAGGREALALMESRIYNLVVTDLAMPEMDGWATASEIKRRWPGTKVVLATGYAVSSDLVESRSDLVDAVIYKPIRVNDITAALNKVLAH
jgi:PAS domain S-box-containing protein